jgi:hypothetical protein
MIAMLRISFLSSVMIPLYSLVSQIILLVTKLNILTCASGLSTRVEETKTEIHAKAQRENLGAKDDSALQASASLFAPSREMFLVSD